MKSLACKDMGIADCDFVATAETEEEVMAQITEHGKSAHQMTDEQMSTPENVEKMKAAMKDA
jgi:predicted small metal-binding protein